MNSLASHLDSLYRGVRVTGGWHHFADNLCRDMKCDEVTLRLVADYYGEQWGLHFRTNQAIFDVRLTPSCTLQLVLDKPLFRPTFNQTEQNLLGGLAPHLARVLRLALEQSLSIGGWTTVCHFLSSLEVAVVIDINGKRITNSYADRIIGEITGEPERFISKMISCQRPRREQLVSTEIIEFFPIVGDQISGFTGYVVPRKLETELTTLYELTQIQQSIARMLSEGLSLEEVATLAERSKETIRTHSKDIYKKTGVQDQAELARLAAQLQLSLKRH